MTCRPPADPAFPIHTVNHSHTRFREAPAQRRHRHPFGAVHRLDQLVIEAGQQVADDLAVVLGILDDQDPLLHAASIISSTWTGSTTRKVEPWPNAAAFISDIGQRQGSAGKGN